MLTKELFLLLVVYFDLYVFEVAICIILFPFMGFDLLADLLTIHVLHHNVISFVLLSFVQLEWRLFVLCDELTWPITEWLSVAADVNLFVVKDEKKKKADKDDKDKSS